jgi:hypothetical protein
VRPGPWLLLLPLLLSPPALAREHLGEDALQRRTLVIAPRPGEVPPLELHVGPHVATLVVFEAPLRLGAVTYEAAPGHPRIIPTDDETLIIVPGGALAEGERIALTVETEPGAEPLRFVLVTRRGEVDMRVRVVRAKASLEEDSTDAIAQQLLASPEARSTLTVSREMVDQKYRVARGQVESQIWMGRRFFATLAVRGRKPSTPPWRLAQARLRATLADGVLLEWPAQLVTGAQGVIRRRHIATSLLPEGASRLELALDDQDSPGTFQPLAMEEAPTSP